MNKSKAGTSKTVGRPFTTGQSPLTKWLANSNPMYKRQGRGRGRGRGRGPYGHVSQKKPTLISTPKQVKSTSMEGQTQNSVSTQKKKHQFIQNTETNIVTPKKILNSPNHNARQATEQQQLLNTDEQLETTKKRNKNLIGDKYEEEKNEKVGSIKKSEGTYTSIGKIQTSKEKYTDNTTNDMISKENSDEDSTSSRTTISQEQYNNTTLTSAK